MFLVLGSTGYVGKYFLKYISSLGEDVRGLSRVDFDYTDESKLVSLLKEKNQNFSLMQPVTLVNLMWMHANLIKLNVFLGIQFYREGIRNACEKVGVSWGHVSSGCIYSGKKLSGDGWDEEDEPNFSFRNGPCSFYSGSKALGEEVLDGAENCYIWRLRIPFNHEKNPRNYLQKLLNYDNLLDAENSISNIDDYVKSCIDSFTQRL